MKLNAYTIYDNKALQYHAPFFMAADGQAVRALSDLVSDPNTNIGRHPGDYVLYHCGYYNDSTGFLSAEAPLRHIMDAQSLVKLQAETFQGIEK
ncbi:MAG: nonstructural protein [Microvirus sp.]|nr:MAG: nonstructural protein [Microvirus sp.]